MESLAEKAKAELRRMPLGSMGEWVEDHENPTVIPMRRIPIAPNYAASEDGKLFSLKRSTDRGARGILPIPFKEINPTFDPVSGYFVTSLSVNRLNESFRVHQLIAAAFLGWRKFDPMKRKVDHRDCDRRNNSISNLRIVTSSLNGFNRTMAQKAESGFSGVYKTRQGTWEARMQMDHRLYRLASATKTPEESSIIRREAETFFWSVFDAR